MVIKWISKEGGRPDNEDFYGHTRKKGITCAVVADGLGGHSGGEIASRLTVNTILSEFKKEPGFSKEHIERYINTAKDAVVDKAMNDPLLLYMSSTIVVLLIKGRRAMWANVGDSRIYKLYEGSITDVSEDHSLAFLDFVRGSIEYNDIRTSPNQNKLISAIGVSMDGINISEPTSAGVGSAFLLCTDGWWEYVTERDMEETYKNSSNIHDWLKRMIDIREENAPEDSDNYTAMVVMI